jgi:ATP-dependent DNA helicase RecG
MKGIEDIFENLIKPIPTEIKSNGLNTSVFGGFDSYILNWSNKLQASTNDEEIKSLAQDLYVLFIDYEKVILEKRHQKLKESIKLVNELGRKIKGRAVFDLNDKRLRVVKDFPVKKKTKRRKNIPPNSLQFDFNQEKEAEKKQVIAKKDKAKVIKKQQVKNKEEKARVEKGKDNFWHQPIKYVKGVGDYWSKRLKRLEIEELKDLLYYFPRDYNDWSQTKKIRELRTGENVTVQGKVVNINEIKPRSGLKIIKVAISDGTGILHGVWFNQGYIKKTFKKDATFLFSGEVKYSYGNFEINNPHFEEIDFQDNLHTGRIVPVYPTSKGINQKRLRRIIKNALDKYLVDVEEFLPTDIIDRHDFLNLSYGLSMIHFPDSKEVLKEARRRFAYEELFVLQLILALRKSEAQSDKLGIKHSKDDGLVDKFLELLPFALTNAQARVWQEIKGDMESNKNMNRLLQGDVGAGKTVIATLALLKTVQSEFQGALMAPTEILAEQHYLGLKDDLEPLGLKLGLLVGSLKAKEKRELLEKIEAGEVDIVIGTHALIQEGINFSNLGLAIVDEQHRFGVKQRATLQEKGDNPDVLVMTATPIPRTLALTVYGDLDVSVIDELPPGRKPVITEWRTQRVRDKIYSFLREEIDKGRQAYVVCPLVEESEKLDIESATELSIKLQNEYFPDLKIALLHGQMKAVEKEEVMEEFRVGNTDILVSTTVIEVGVNVPNASVMIIEDAQRFGLAQLHQLRGRVGRGQYQSYCILISDPSTDEGVERMKIMTKSTDGFVIAEEDLHLRGPGEFFGTRQHGMPDLKVADILRDHKLLELAREDAFALIKADPKLEDRENKRLKSILTENFNYDFELIDIS